MFSTIEKKQRINDTSINVAMSICLVLDALKDLFMLLASSNFTLLLLVASSSYLLDGLRCHFIPYDVIFLVNKEKVSGAKKSTSKTQCDTHTLWFGVV
jgi:hypothetical protein